MKNHNNYCYHIDIPKFCVNDNYISTTSSGGSLQLYLPNKNNSKNNYTDTSITLSTVYIFQLIIKYHETEKL